MKLYCGTSGYQYSWWKDSYYPRDIINYSMLEYYSKEFNTVEINYTFYKFPNVNTIKNWYTSTPANFKFSIKVNQLITHYKKLRNVGVLMRKFIKITSHLKNKLACLLFQFPTNFRYNAENFRRLSFLHKYIPSNIKYAFEFRHPSWFNENVYDLFNKHKWIITLSYYPNILIKKYGFDTNFTPSISDYKNLINTKYIYVRLHGSNSEYGGSHDIKTLKHIKKLIEDNNFSQAFIYFNNTDSLTSNLPSAILDARRIKKMLVT